jgi:hypothetical protein
MASATQPQPGPSIREVLLQEIEAQEEQLRTGHTLQKRGILDGAAKKLSGYDEQAILTQFNELFRTGLLAPGLNLCNPDLPFVHLTERGREALGNVARDPSNPAGYLRHFLSVAKVNEIVMSYLTEALDCYVGGHFKAAAVIVGCAAENLILSLRDAAVSKLLALGKQVPKDLKDWKAKTASDALRKLFDAHQSQFKPELRDAVEAYWSALAFQIRSTRNEAGHPLSITPVTSDRVHASLLMFPELAKLVNQLEHWVANELS